MKTPTGVIHVKIGLNLTLYTDKDRSTLELIKMLMNEVMYIDDKQRVENASKEANSSKY